jgi:hypothetical protein
MDQKTSDDQAFDTQPSDDDDGEETRPPGPFLPLLPPLQAEPGVTALAGEVRRLNGRPLAGVTLRIEDKTVQTDDTGRFLLTSIPSGHHELHIDGRTANQPGRIYGVFEVGVDLTEGETNVLTYAI